jgi:hypothetical protein
MVKLLKSLLLSITYTHLRWFINDASSIKYHNLMVFENFLKQIGKSADLV